MMIRILISVMLIGLFLSPGAVLAVHSPTAWTQGHYSGSEVSADDVVAYWSFEEPEKDGLVVAEDGSPRGNVLVEHPMHPDRTGVVKLGPGKSGEAFFSATATGKDRACRSMSQDFNLKHAFTVEMWFKLDPGLWAKTQGRNLTLFCLDDNCQGGQERSAMGHLVQLPDAPPNTFSLEFLRRVDDKPRSEHRQMVSRHKVVLPGGAWHHVAFSWDGEKARTYLDGKLLSEAKQTTGALLDSAEIWVGSHFWMSGFLGSIDSVRVLDRAIAFAEPGKQPTVLPRPIRNAAAPIAQRPATRMKRPAWVQAGDSLPVTPLYVSHGRATAARITVPPRIDGRLDDATWQQTTAYGNFMNNTGHYAATDQAEVRVCYDDRNLYFGMTVFDQNVKLMRTRVDRGKRDLNVYDDDSIEVFLDVNGDRKTYYHVAINANGAIYDARIGAETDKSWNGVTQSAGSVGEGKWFAEFSVPLAALGVEDLKQVSRMGFNVGREQYSRDGQLLSQWVPGLSPSGGFHTPRAFGVLVFGDAGRARPTFDPGKLRATWQDGELTLDLSVAGGTDPPGKVVAEFSGGELEQRSEVRTAVLQTGQARAVIPLHTDWKRCFVRLGLFDSKAPDRSPEDMLVATFDLPDLLALRLLQPHYRDNIYAGQELDHVVVEVHSGLPRPVELRFGPRGAKPTFTRRIESVLDPVTVTIPAKDLAEGKHEVTARLLTAGGDVVSSKTITLRKLPAHPHTVRLREDGIWLRRGKPYMPVGYFSLQVRGSAPTIAELVRTQGINAGLSYHLNRGNDPDIQRLLDEAAKHDVSILIYPVVGQGRPGTQGYQDVGGGAHGSVGKGQSLQGSSRAAGLVHGRRAGTTRCDPVLAKGNV